MSIPCACPDLLTIHALVAAPAEVSPESPEGGHLTVRAVRALCVELQRRGEEIEGLKWILASIPNENQRVRAEAAEARVRELEAWKLDTEESFRVTLEDRGAHDELHCSCVPVLRERVRELEEWQRQMVEKASAKSLNGYRELAAKCAALEAENERLREALEAVEWADPYCEERFSFCPWCHRSFGIGHAPDCQRQLALMVTTDRGEG